MSNPIDRIRKLLALADSPNEHEAALAAERAAEIAAKHGIDMAQVAMDDGRRLAAEGGEVEVRLTPWRRVLAAAVARSMGGASVNSRHSRTEGVIHFYGPPGTVEAMIALLKYLEHQVLTLSATATATRVEKHINGRTFRSNYQYGIVVRLQERLQARQAEREQGNEDSGMALVVIRDAVNEAVQDNHPDAKVTVIRYAEGAGYHHGAAAGDGVSFGDVELQRERAALGAGS